MTDDKVEPCEGCDGSGIRSPATPDGAGNPPVGFVFIERCDVCERYPDDLVAANICSHGAQWWRPPAPLRGIYAIGRREELEYHPAAVEPFGCPHCLATPDKLHYLEDISSWRQVLGPSERDPTVVQIDGHYSTEGCDDSPANRRFFCTACGHWWPVPADFQLEFC